jgi:hypothetical protein
LSTAQGPSGTCADVLHHTHAQAWKEQLFPLLQDHLAQHVDASIAYLVLYHEAAVANLVEVCLCFCVAPQLVLTLLCWLCV